MPQKKTTKGYPDLHLAAQHNETAAIESALIDGANVNARDSDGNTPCMVAAFYLNFRAISLFLMAADLDINATNKYQQTAIGILINHLHNKSSRSNMSSRLFKIQINAYIERLTNTQPLSSTDRFLLAAQTGGKLTVIRYITLNPYRLNETNNFGCSALLLAAGSFQTAVATLLLDANADINATDRLGISPLVAATLSNNSEIVRLLLDAKENNGSYKISLESRQEAYECAQSKGYVEVANAIYKTMGFEPRPVLSADTKNDSVMVTAPLSAPVLQRALSSRWRLFATEKDIQAALQSAIEETATPGPSHSFAT